MDRWMNEWMNELRGKNESHVKLESSTYMCRVG